MTHSSLHSRLVVASMFFALAACRGGNEPTESESFDATESSLTEGTPKAVGVLALLNAESTTLTVLDDDVPLDKRAAKNLIAFRYGPDGILGTGDDSAFRTIAEVDAVKWVGPTALTRLAAYAENNDWVPQDGDLLGVYEGVAFTVAQAEATLALANTAAHEVLDDDVSLDRRAADGIVAARPLATLIQLSEAYYVGQSAMLKLRDYATPPLTGPPTGLANGEECTIAQECASGLCVGETLGWGMCDDPSMAGNFSWEDAANIPDGDPSGLVMTVDVQSLASVPVDVVLSLDIDHPNKADLIVVLRQPGGPFEVIWNNEADPPAVVSALWGIERDNMVNGVWTVEVIDTVSGNAGEFRSANLYLTSRWD